MKKILLILVLISGVIISCKENSDVQFSTDILGKWELETMDIPTEATDFPERLKQIKSNLNNDKVILEFDKEGKYFTNGIDKPVAQNYEISSGVLIFGLDTKEGFNIFILNDTRMVLKKEYESSTLVMAFKKID